MKISAIVPTFNSLNVGNAVQSILNQTLKPFEIIVSDDASTDPHALRILEDLKSLSPLVRILKNKDNLGPSGNRNRGWDNARADYDYITFLDSDDSWVPNKLEKQIAFMQKHPESLLSAHWFDHQPKKVSGELKRSHLLWSNVFSPSTMMAHKNLKTRFDESFRYCEDHEFAITASYETPIQMLPEVLTTLGREPGSAGGLSHQKWRMRKGQIQIYWKLRAAGRLSTLNALSFTGVSLAKHIAKTLRIR